MLLLSQKKIRQVAPGHARSPKESHRVHGRGGVANLQSEGGANQGGAKKRKLPAS